LELPLRPWLEADFVSEPGGLRQTAGLYPLARLAPHALQNLKPKSASSQGLNTNDLGFVEPKLWCSISDTDRGMASTG